jgi:hypothetical protein
MAGAAVFLLVARPLDFLQTPPPAVLQLELESIPPGAGITAGGKPRGQTPARLELPAGLNSLVLQRPGFTPYNLELDITDSGRATRPTYRYTVELWPSEARAAPLQPPFPNARLENARYLGIGLMELVYLTVDRAPLPPASGGLPTNLWLRPAGSATAGAVLLSYPALEKVSRAYGLSPAAVSLSAPAVSGEGRRLAFVSRYSPPSTGKPAEKPGEGEILWLVPLGENPAADGAYTSGEDPLPLFRLSRLAGLLPGLSLPEKGTARLEQLYWNPAGDRLLAVLGLPETSGRTLTLMLVVGAGAGSAPGAVSLATPQPVTGQVLPGTVGWNKDGTALSFLVAQPGGSGRASLCVLGLAGTGKASPGRSRETPLEFLGEVNGAGVWEQSRPVPDIPARFNLPPYGPIRTGPFAWPDDRPEGLYGAGRATGNGSETGLFRYRAGEEEQSLLATPTPDRQKPAAARLESYPFWPAEGLPRFLSGTVTGGAGGKPPALSITLKPLEAGAVPAGTVSLPGGVSLAVRRSASDPLVFPAFSEVRQLKFEAAWRPDGQELLLFLPAVPGPQAWVINRLPGTAGPENRAEHGR